MTCDNIVFNKINSYNRVVDINGLCVCDTGYFDDMINWNCQPCASVQPACQKCTYQKITNSTNYIFECQQCGYGFYVSTGTCMNCSVNHPGCLNCSNDGDVCYSCDESENYFYDPHLEYFSSTNSNISNNSMVMYCTLCLKAASPATHWRTALSVTTPTTTSSTTRRVCASPAFWKGA